jgi:hypothetical protein
LTDRVRARNVEAVSDGISRSWNDLHRLRASFGAPRSRVDDQVMRGVARALGATAVPLCARELGGAAARRAWAVALLRVIAQVAGERVRVELRAVVAGGGDEAKLAALSLLAELGDETATAQFEDPREVHKQSLAKFASQLASPAEIASAADLLVSRLPPEEIVELLEAFSETDPDRARALGDELAARVDLDVSARGEVSRVVAPLRLRAAGERAARSPARPLGRPALLTGLRHLDGRVVIAVARRVASEARWRSLATLCSAAGALDQVFYDDDTTPRRVRDELIAPLLDDGYARFAITTEGARRLVAAAARRAVAAGHALPSPYYLGRDLLGRAHTHLGRAPGPDRAALLGRAIDLLAAGNADRARPLLEHCAAAGPDDADALSNLGLCRFAQGEFAGAMTALERALWLEPAWPLHHWNLAAAAHRAGELAACARALRGFLEHSGDALAAAIDPEHARRVALARRFLADHLHHRRVRDPDLGLAPV